MFLGMDWLAALITISFQVVFAIVTAFPAMLAWNCIAPIYLSFLPSVYHHIPYWHVVAILLSCTFVGEQIKKLVPTFVNIHQEVKK